MHARAGCRAVILGRRFVLSRNFSNGQATAAVGHETSNAEEVHLYRSAVDVAAAVTSAQQKCWIGTGLGACGFLGVLAGSAATATPLHYGLLLVGAAANSYINLIQKPERLRALAMRHVEEITMIRPRQQEPALLEGADDNVDGEAGPLESATTEDTEVSSESAWFESAAEVRLKIKCANVEHDVLITEAASPWDGSRFTGFVVDDRITLGDLCQTSRLLYVDADDGETPDRELLRMMSSTTKVLSEDLVELRSDVPSNLRLSAKDLESLEGRLSEVKPEHVKKLSAIPMKETPVQQIQGIGSRAIGMGFSMIVASIMFQFRPRPSDPSKDFHLKDLILHKPPQPSAQ